MIAALGRSDAARRILRMTGWTMVAFAVEKAASIAIVLFLAELLGARDYGRFVLAQGLVSSLQILVVLGAGPVFTKYIPVLRKESFRRAVELISLCLTLAFGVAVVLTLIALTAGRAAMADALVVPRDSALPIWLIGWVVISAGSNMVTTLLLAFERGRALGLAAAFGSALTVLVVPAFAHLAGLQGAIIALVGVEALKLLCLVGLFVAFAHRQGGPVLARPRFGDLSLMMRFGLPVFLSGAVWGPAMWLAQLIVSTRSPDGLSQVGVFGLSNTVMGLVILVSSLSNRAAVPVLSSLEADGRRFELWRVSRTMSLTQIGVSSLVAVPLAVATPWIVVAFGPEFASHWPILLIMVGTGVLLSGQTALGNYFLVTGRQGFILLSLLPWAAILLSASWIFSAYGAYAIALGLLVASLIRTLMFLVPFLAVPAILRTRDKPGAA